MITHVYKNKWPKLLQENFFQSVQKATRRKKGRKQEVGDALSICVLYLLQLVSTLINLLAISVMIVKI